MGILGVSGEVRSITQKIKIKKSLNLYKIHTKQFYLKLSFKKINKQKNYNNYV